jgi:serine-type D-Ala-D-Ala carboxypeptidase/endopeptidase
VSENSRGFCIFSICLKAQNLLLMRNGKKIFLKVFSFFLVLILSLIAFIYFSVDNNLEKQPNPSPFKNQKIIKRLDHSEIISDSLSGFITALMRKANVHGLAVSIFNNNELVYQKLFGFKSRDEGELLVPGTVFYGASFSKTILADIVVQLAEAKVIHLDTPLYTYLKHPLYSYKTNIIERLLGANYIDYADLKNDNRYKLITARMCLSHTTGLPNWRWLEEDKKLKIKFTPGTRYSYSGEGMFLLQFVIEQITGKDFKDIASEKVLKPLKMNSSSYVWQRSYEGNYCVGHDAKGNNLRIPKSNVANAAGSISTTLEDYTKFFQAVLKQNKSRYKELLTQQIRIRSKQQFGPNAWVDTDENDSIQLSYGLGFGLFFTPYGKAFFKEGHLDGWQHYAVGFPEKGMGIVIMANSDNAESIFKELLEGTIANYYTPWYWEHYIPYDQKVVN